MYGRSGVGFHVKWASPHVSEAIPSTSSPNTTMRKNDDDQNETKTQEDESLSDWISGGPIGSKGAVLVFRSCVLASTTPSMESPNKTVGNNTGTAILLNKAKNMAKRLVAEPHSFSMRPKNIMHDVLETFGNTNVYTGNAYIVKHESETEEPVETQNGEPKRDIQDVLNDLNKITLKKNLNVENTTANIKIAEEGSPPPVKISGKASPKCSRKAKSCGKSRVIQKAIPSPDSDISENSLVKQIDNFKVLESSNMPARILNVTYKLVNTETKLLNRLLQAHGLEEAVADSKDFNLLWSGLHPKPDVLRSLAPYQRVNHFPRSYELTRKDKLFKNIEKMQYFRGLKHFDFIPTTFLMPVEYKELCSTHCRTKGPWIVKPAASSRGRGIYIVNSPEQIPKGENVVVAKYIDKPLLIDGHKCDLRLYVCVTCIDPLLIYLYEEGLVRFATVKYDSSNKNLWNPCMHLCNYSINKYHTDYIKCDDPNAGNIGHKWTLSALLRHLRKQGRNTTQLMASIEDLVIKSILSSAQTITSAARAFVPNFFNCFELFGYDILIDDTLKPWLLEINLSPSLGCDSPLDARVKSALIADTLTLVGLPAVPASGKVDNNINSLKMRIGACRRVHSAENVCPRGAKGAVGSNMTGEEARLVRAVKAQYYRRGGFVRIFPAQNSWQKYSQYLDPVSGVPVCSTCINNPSGVLPHNYNLLLHSRLLPQTPITHTPERLKRYEAVTVTSTAPPVSLTDGRRSPPTAVDSRRVKDKLKQQLIDGCKLTTAETRRAFGLFLSHVLKRVAGCHHPQAAPLAAIVSRFLKRAVTSLRVPYNIQGPTVKMCDKDRCAIVAKQLNDFLYMYYRDTDLCTDSEDKDGYIPSLQFAQFLCSASEADLEDVLLLVLRLENQVTPFLGDGRSTYCVDLPRDKLLEHKDHVLLRYLAHIVPLHSRKFRVHSPDGTMSPATIPMHEDSDAIVKDSLKEEKPMNVALKYARS